MARAYGLSAGTPTVLSMPFITVVLVVCTALPFLTVAALCAAADARPATYGKYKVPSWAPHSLSPRSQTPASQVHRLSATTAGTF